MVDKSKDVIERKKIPMPLPELLPGLCNKAQVELIRKYIYRGAAFIVLGSEFAPITQMQKAIYREMTMPCSNGIMMYDSRTPFKKQYEREIVTISLNDEGNKNLVHSIKLLGAVRSKTLYAYNSVKGE